MRFPRERLRPPGRKSADADYGPAEAGHYRNPAPPFKSLHFDELDRDAVGSLNHCRAAAAPRVNLLEELDAFGLQPADRRGQIRGAQRPVIDELAARGDEPAA